MESFRHFVLLSGISSGMVNFHVIKLYSHSTLGRHIDAAQYCHYDSHAKQYGRSHRLRSISTEQVSVNGADHRRHKQDCGGNSYHREPDSNNQTNGASYLNKSGHNPEPLRVSPLLEILHLRLGAHYLGNACQKEG